MPTNVESRVNQTKTNPGKILQAMGIEISPDDPRTAEEILNEINRQRIETNCKMEPDPVVREQMRRFGVATYPLASDKLDEV